jgi:hypothetical protein
MSKKVADIIVKTLQSGDVKHCYVALQEVLPAAAWGDGKRVDTDLLTREYQNSNVSLAHQGPRVRDTQTPWKNLAMNQSSQRSCRRSSISGDRSACARASSYPKTRPIRF